MATLLRQVPGMDESEDPIAGRKKDLFYTKIKQTNKQTNKNYPVGEKQTGRLARLDKAGLDTRRTPMNDIWQRTHTELQTEGDYKGSK